MRPLRYSAPETLQEGLRTIAAGAGDARLLAGGTDLVPLMKARIESPQILVSVRRMRELSADIALGDAGLHLGALTTLAEIERHAGIAEHFAALAQAASSAATPQLRNMATLGGTLLQRPRCWYFRDARCRCWLKGGAQCDAREGQSQQHAIFETGPCRAVHPSDLAVALSALGAEVLLQGVRGKRRVPIVEFFAPPDATRRRESMLAPGEIVTAVYVPRPAGEHSVFIKAMDRSAWAFATVSVGASLRLRDARIDGVTMFLGGVASVPWSVNAAMAPLVGSVPAETAFDAAARAALADAQPLRMNGYKIPLAQALVRRALQLLTTR